MNGSMMEMVVVNQEAPKKKAKKTPSIKSVQRMVDGGWCRATDGCVVEPDGVCPHGAESWALVLGLI